MNSPKLLSLPKSGETFYFRSYIPKDLIPHFGGLKQFRISLKCAIKSRSTRTTKILAKTISGIYEEIRQGFIKLFYLTEKLLVILLINRIYEWNLREADQVPLVIRFLSFCSLL